MNITIGPRTKSLQTIHINHVFCTDQQQLRASSQRRAVQKVQSHDLGHNDCQFSQVTRWIMRKCFTKTNSILEDQPQEPPQHNQKLIIHSLSSKRAKQDSGLKQRIQDPSAAQTRRGSSSRSKGMKIKVETCKEASKTARILRLKTCQAKMNATTRPTSSSTSGHASRERLNEKVFQIVQHQMGETKSLAHLEGNSNRLLNKLSWKIYSEQKHKIQDCIYEPIFLLDNTRKLSEKPALATPQKQYALKFGQSPSQVDSDESFVLFRGLDQIFQLPAVENSSRIRKSLYKPGSRQKMFVIYEKNDEALQYE